jgi:hypothetical protein
MHLINTIPVMAASQRHLLEMPAKSSRGVKPANAVEIWIDAYPCCGLNCFQIR